MNSKKIIILVLLGAGIWYWLQLPAAEKFTASMNFEGVVEFDGVQYVTDWSSQSEQISGFLRRKDRHNSSNFPIITFDWVVTTKDYNDSSLVSVRHQGDGNYAYSYKTKVEGSIVFYHLITADENVQKQLVEIKEGRNFVMTARISQSNKLENLATGVSLDIAHSNHKIVLVESLSIQ
ncbi:hypothetical protein [Marinicellulosiphila megalodicopiae]|uniref:hypothetical protein n=1 Tax=Marinicellulosiphila megalodicopiae TaxID=2724896 RepID=UPI003BAF125F